MRLKAIVLGLALATIGGCTTYNYPAPLSENEAAAVMLAVTREHPRERIYRQYVQDSQYLQFERVGEDDVLYGWRTCTTCDWTRLQMAAVYDGSYLYLIYGHHEDFFMGAPDDTRLIDDDNFQHWSWNTVDKFQVEGRNLVKLSEWRACPYSSVARVQEWTAPPYRSDGIDCRYKSSRGYSTVWVATVDETLAGERDSMVDTAIGDTIQERLKRLEALRRDGTITDTEYQQRRREILEEI